MPLCGRLHQPQVALDKLVHRALLARLAALGQTNFLFPGDWQLHEIQPVKFGGNPLDIGNKMPLPAGVHSEVTNWWNAFQQSLESPR